MKPARSHSLRRYLLYGILLPVSAFILINTFSFYRQALTSVNTAYDRTLLASAKAIGEHIVADGDSDAAKLRANIPYAAFEVFEADNRSRMVYRISDVKGELVDGFADLAVWRGRLPDQGPYAALVDFYDDVYLGNPVRVAVLLQPVAMGNARAMAIVQVAETLELRRTLARQILVETIWRNILLVGIIAVVVTFVVQRATAPVRRLSVQIRERSESDLSPLIAPDAPLELVPLIEATNGTMARLSTLLEHQKRFIRDTSHQLRTPLAVLKVQVQSALRGDVDPMLALTEIRDTVDRATNLSNQMLKMAKVEQLRQQPASTRVDLATVLRDIALDVSPLVVDKKLDFEILTVATPLLAHEWMLRELCSNLILNALRHSPIGGVLRLKLVYEDEHAKLVISDDGPGIAAELQERLFQPFSAGSQQFGSGLGLAICQEIVGALGGRISLDHRKGADNVLGLDATVRLPLGVHLPSPNPS